MNRQQPSQSFASGRPTILLRSSWQGVNIGDISHTLGLGQLLRQYLPEAHIILWPSRMEERVARLLRHHLPGLEILDPRDAAAQDQAMDRADLLLHGSGPGVLGRAAIERWRDRTDKPFGLFGVTVQDPPPDLAALLNGAAFLFTRETASLDHLRQAGCLCPMQAFTPDAVFAMDIRNEGAGEAICRSHGLEPGRFICAIPRLRYTPYHLIREVDWTQEKIRHVTETNERHGFDDQARLREPIIRWVRETGMPVLVCPEMTYELDIIDPLVIDPLPDDVKPKVKAYREFWLPDAAQAVYARAAYVVSLECHSPIMALAVRTPAFYVRQPEDTIKGQMYYDLDLDPWVFEIDATDPATVAERLMTVHASPDEAAARCDSVRARCADLHRQAMDAVTTALAADQVIDVQR
jgi:hypothetical protein